MRTLAVLLMTFTISCIVLFVIVLIGKFTVGYKEIMHYATFLLVGYESARFSNWLIDKIKKK